MRERSLGAWHGFAVRAVVAMFVAALLATSFGDHAMPAVGADLTQRISSARNGQSYFERQMRKQDRILARMERKGDKARRKLRRATRSIKRTHKRYIAASREVRLTTALLEGAEARYADPAEAPDPQNWSAKMVRLRRDAAKALDHRRGLGIRLRKSKRQRNARTRQLAELRRARQKVLARLRLSEGALAAQIVRMTSLAQQRAASQTPVRLTADGSTFAWPSQGKITQPFGCTGFRLNPSRGSCRHFHDGIDLVSSYGSDVRAAAVGVIAFAGWNPWDEGRRAFIVVIGHPDGYVTRYGHLVPGQKVRPGQLVRKGQNIGRMGSTGNSTGTHLHMELLRHGAPLNPMTYLPDVGNAKQAKAKKLRKAKQARSKKSRKARRAHRSQRVRARQVRRDRASQRGAADAAASAATRLACLAHPRVTELEHAQLAGVRIPGYVGPEGAPDPDEVVCLPDLAAPEAASKPETLAAPFVRSRPGIHLTADVASPAARLSLRGTSPIPQ